MSVRSSVRENGTGPVQLYLESTPQRSFAVAVHWPGWARAGRTPDAATHLLDEYLPRYLEVVRAAGLEPPDPTQGYAVVERVPGNATTRFGAPGVVPELDRARWDPDDVEHRLALLTACWDRLEQAVAAAPPVLRKGPRGGGRDRDAIVEHVWNAEAAYARKAGVRVPAPTDRAGALVLRERLVAAIRCWPEEPERDLSSSSPAAAGTHPAGGRAVSGWPAPYVLRRTAWHALDHAWEIDDRH